MAKPNLIGSPNLGRMFVQSYEHYLPTAFDESMTLLQKVNKVIHYLFELERITQEMLDRWNEVIEWVLNEGLEEAVKDKLEEWLKDGTLQDIINGKPPTEQPELPEFDFDKLLEEFKKEIEKLKVGITDSYHFEEITVEKMANANGAYYVTTIPTVDKLGNKIYLEKGYANDDTTFKGTLETPRSYATRTHSSLTINASTFNVDTNKPVGRHIKDGKVHRDTNDGTGYTLGYNRTTQKLTAHAANVTAETMIKDFGVTDAWGAFYPIIEKGVNVPSSVWSKTLNSSEKNPRQVVAQMADKTIKIFTFRGREDDHAGYTFPEMQDVLQTHGVDFAFNLDGGGSTGTIKSNLFVNSPIDRNFGDERKVLDFISVKKTSPKGYEDIYASLGELSATVGKLDARHISKYGDDIPSNLRFHNFLYLDLDKAIYAYNKQNNPDRILGMYTDESSTQSDGRIYFGNLTAPLSIQAMNNITVVLGNNDLSYRINLTENSKWTDFPVENGWTLNPQRELQFRKMNNYESRLRGSVVHGTGDKSGAGMKIGTLPSGTAPKTQMVFPVSITSGPRELNNIIIYNNGDIVLQYPISSPNINTAVNIDCVINRET